MGSLHCARICMDVIAAVIGPCRSRPASQPRSPRLADSADPGPPPQHPPGTKRPGRGGGAGLGVPHAEGAGRGAALSFASRGRGPGRWPAAGAQPAGGGLAGSGPAGWKTRDWLSEVGEDVLGSHDVSVPPAPRSCNAHARRGEGPNGQEKEDAERPREARSPVGSLQLLILQIRLAP